MIVKPQITEFDIENYLRTFDPEIKDDRVKKWTERFEQMAVHFRKMKPEKILTEKRPNEDLEIKAYRLKVYRPITYGSINKSYDSLVRMFSNFTFHIKGDDDVINYIDGENFYIHETDEWQSFNSWVEKLVIKRMLEDANGVILWLYEMTDKDRRPQPIPHLIYSYNIINLEPNYFTFKADDEKEILSDSTETDVYYTVDNNSVYRFYKISADKYEYSVILTHNLGYLPIVILGGDLTSAGIYDSFFAPYCAFGDEAICQFSDWQGVMVASGHPIREELAIDCTNPTCVQGLDKITNKTCNVCNGAGYYIPRTPYGVFQRKLPSNIDSNDIQNFNVPAVRFISPNIEHVKLASDVWEVLIKKAEESLHLTDVNLEQSGIAKEYDREPREDMLAKISNNIYDNIFRNSLKIISDYRGSKNIITIIKPSNYKIKTEKDILQEVNAISQSKTPSYFIAETVKQLAVLQFKTNPIARKTYDFLSVYDPLFFYSQETKERLLNSGNTTKEMFMKSMYSLQVINEIVEELTPTVFMDLYDYNRLKQLADSKFSKLLQTIQIKQVQVEPPEFDV